MIFITIGTQEPFDRLIQVCDELAGKFDNELFFAQVSTGIYKVRNMKIVDFLSPMEFEQVFSKAKLIISHAGIGTIVSAMLLNKPIVVLPRLASLGEHRSEHQLATAQKMRELNYVHTCFSSEELFNKICELIASQNLAPLQSLGRWASEELIASLKKDINS